MAHGHAGMCQQELSMASAQAACAKSVCTEEKEVVCRREKYPRAPIPHRWFPRNVIAFGIRVTRFKIDA
jgi:hypothetical protein